MSIRSLEDSRRRRSGLLVSSMSAAIECAEQRLLLSAAAVDGTGNNLLHPQWGSTQEDLLRLANAEYADAVSAVGGEHRPSARLISNTVSDSGSENVISDRLMSAMVYAWGQFIDHDMTLTASGTTEKMSIPVPTGDPSFDPLGTGKKTIDTMRSAFDPLTGKNSSNPREQINQITAFLDGSMVYGSDSATAASLRTFVGGKMKTSAGDLLPVDASGMFQAGDVRANENPELTSLQTLFVREHNLQAAKIKAQAPTLSDENVYQKARAIVIAEIQAITYNEWLPSLIGQGAISRYAGYDATVNAGISNEFATAAFRFGHSLLGDDIEFLDNNGLKLRDAVSLSQAFFNPQLVKQNGIDPLLKYLSSDPSSEVDTEVVDSVRNFLFGPPGSGGLDLASLNIQRGRDHGLADYNTVRQSIGLPKVKSFSEITSDRQLQAKLQSLYGSVEDIDLWVGGLAEDHVRGSSVGVTFQTIIADQFERLRDGDRYWYQNQFSGNERAQLERTSLSDIIERNTKLTSIQQNAFFFKAGISGTIAADLNRDRKISRDEPRVPNARVQLIHKEDGSVVATTMTDRQGNYRFGVADDLRTGVYQVKVTNADGTAIVTSGDVAITSGDDFKRVDLAVPVPTPPRPDPPKPQSPKAGSPSSTQPPARLVAVAQGGIATPVRSITSGNSSSQSLVGPVGSSASAHSGDRGTTTAAERRRGTTESATSATMTMLLTAAKPSLPGGLHDLIDSLFENLPQGLP